MRLSRTIRFFALEEAWYSNSFSLLYRMLGREILLFLALEETWQNNSSLLCRRPGRTILLPFFALEEASVEHCLLSLEEAWQGICCLP